MPRAALSVVQLALSPTPLADEHRRLDRALTRVPFVDAPFDASRYAPSAVGRAREAWRARMAAEHRSTTVFSQLAAQLIEANATLDCATTMLRMAADELRHTETCGRVVAALGGAPACAVDVRPVPLARHRDCTPEARALRNVLYTTCLSEMVSVARLADEVEQTTDPFLRAASRAILADEVLHGQFGFHYLRAWRPWIDEKKGRRRDLEAYLAHAFAVLEHALLGELGRVPAPSDDERALGLADPERIHAIVVDTLGDAVAPGLAAVGLDGERAWKRRRRVGGRTAKWRAGSRVV